MFGEVPVIVIPGGRDYFGTSWASWHLGNVRCPPCKPTRNPCPRTIWCMNIREELPMPVWIPGRLRNSSLLFLPGPKRAQTFRHVGGRPEWRVGGRRPGRAVKSP